MIKSSYLGRQFAYYVIGASSILTLLFTTIHIMTDYYAEVGGISAKMSYIESHILPGLARSVWEYNFPMLELQASTIANMKYISSVRVLDIAGYPLVSLGDKPIKHGMVHSFPINWLRQNMTQPIGVLEVTASMDEIIHQLSVQVVKLLISNGIKTLIMAALILFLAHRLFIKRILLLTQYIDRFGKENLPQQLHDGRLVMTDSAGSDEIAQLFRAFSTMTVRREKMESSLLDAQQDLLHEKQRADEANRAKSVFLANMSHELRTPLNAVIGFSDMLMTAPKPKQQELLGRSLNMINDAGLHLLKIVGDLLQISTLEVNGTELNKQWLVLDDVVRGTLEMNQPLLEKKQLIFTSDINGTIEIYADRHRMIQILNNLISNAIKYSQVGGELGMCAGVEEGYLKVTVWDNGIGIDPSYHSLIFEAFKQVDMSYTRKFGGVGLGLAICQNLVELHGGRIWVESAGGSGSRFHFTLPMVKVLNT